MYVPSPKRPLVEGVGVGVGAAGLGLGVAAVGVGVAAVGAGLGVAAAGVGLAAFGLALAAVAVGLGVGRGADVVAFGAGVGEGVAGVACAAAAAGSPGAASSESVEGATKTPMIMRTHRAPAPAAAAVCHLGAPARQSHQAAAGQIARLVTTFLVRGDHAANRHIKKRPIGKASTRATPMTQLCRYHPVIHPCLSTRSGL